MTDNHPMTPSPSQLDQWEADARATTNPSLLDEAAIRAGHFGVVHRKALRLAFAAGADEELRACCEWLSIINGRKVEAEFLCSWRRPKPPSLKEQALYALDEALSSDCLHLNGLSDIIRHALESLPD